MALEKVIIIGAGPAGLTAAYELSKSGVRSIVLEKGSRVGGLARTEKYKGYRIDFWAIAFTKVPEVETSGELGDDSFTRRAQPHAHDRALFAYRRASKRCAGETGIA
jgi:protoporphyrinogen oxidase